LYQDISSYTRITRTFFLASMRGPQKRDSVIKEIIIRI
jgi:hypothetical protein